MRYFLLLWLAALPVCFAASQIDVIPEAYEQELRQSQRQYRQLLRQYDFVIDPIEQVALSPSALSSLAGGNWGNQYLGINENYTEIVRRAARGVVIFIFDTAGEFKHPALVRSTWNELGRSYTGEGTLADGNGHGTHCAGIVYGSAAEYDLGLARPLAQRGLIHGVPIKVLTNSGAGQFSWVDKALEEQTEVAKAMIADGYFVIFSFSLGGSGRASSTDQLIVEAEKAGVLVFAAAGNTYGEGISAPANGPSAHAIGALNQDGTRAEYSTTGDELYLASPGTRVLSTYPPNLYRELSGTSMATPSQAALAAIAASVHPRATNRQISRFLAAAARDLPPGQGWDKETGFGDTPVRRILDGDPLRFPDSGNGNPSPIDEPDEPRKTKRFLILRDLPAVRVPWRPLNGTTWRWATLQADIEFYTDLYAPSAYDAAVEEMQDYFHRRAFVLRNSDDFADLAYWARYFFEMESRRNGLNLRLLGLHATDDGGRTAYEPRQMAQRLRAKLRKWGKPEIRNQELNLIPK